MWLEDPENRLTNTRRRQAELRAEAATNRLSRAGKGAAGTYRVRGLHLQIGNLLIVVGRSLCDEERRQPEPAH
jgi:hypothetical protein